MFYPTTLLALKKVWNDSLVRFNVTEDSCSRLKVTKMPIQDLSVNEIVSSNENELKLTVSEMVQICAGRPQNCLSSTSLGLFGSEISQRKMFLNFSQYISCHI